MLKPFLPLLLLLMLLLPGTLAVPAQAQNTPALPSCFTDWQVVGSVDKTELGPCQVVVGFPTPTRSGANQAIGFKVDRSVFDDSFKMWLLICRSDTGLTPSNGFSIQSDELDAAIRYGGKHEQQLGTTSSGGQDCVNTFVTSSDTVWLIQPIGHPDSLVSITFNGIPKPQ